MDGGFPNIRSEWPQILQMIKSDDEMLVYQGAMELRDALAYAQENQMHGFQTEQYLDILVKIINRDIMTDLGNEVKFFSIQCLSTLMDIFPGSVNSLVHAGLVKGMSNVLQNSFGFIDLSEACIKAFEKIVLENPPAVLRSGAIGIILQQMDFFEQSTQQRIFRIILKIARHSSSENDFDTHLMPILPFLITNLECHLIQSDQKKLEDVSKIIYEMQESFLHFFSPIHEIKKIGEQYEKLSDFGLYDMYMEHVKLYTKSYSRIVTGHTNEESKQSEQNTQNNLNGLENNDIVDSQQINSLQQGSTIQTVSNQFIINALKLFENSCKFSNKISNKLFSDQRFIQNLSEFLPNQNIRKQRQYNQENYPFINEVVNLMNSLFSEKDFDASEKQNTQEIKLLDDKAQQQVQSHIQMKQEFENEKMKFQLNPKNRQIILQIAETILPRIFFVYETVINQNLKIKSLQLIKKILALFDDELLKNFIEPKQFANFIFQIIKSKHLSSIEVCLKITKKVLDSSPQTYVVPFIREGVSNFIEEISSDEKFKAYMGIKQEVDLLDPNFDFEIYTVKEALNYTRTNHPEDYQKKEYYERKLLELVEKQKYQQSSERDFIKEKLNNAFNRQKIAIQQKKMELSSKLNNQLIENKLIKQELQKQELGCAEVQKSKNILPLIFQQCKQIMQKYFENKIFLDELKQSSENLRNELSIFDQLKTISSDLCFESTKYHYNIFDKHSCQKVKDLLIRISNLISNDDGITSYEFKNSNLLFALELFLTNTPSKAKTILNSLQNKQFEECKMENEEMKQKNKEGICMINRMKLFIHVFLNKKNGKSTVLPLQALIELNHKVISENDSIFSKISASQSNPFEQNQHHLGHSSIFGIGADYDHFINSLKQLQKRITINLIYDPTKSKMLSKQEEMEGKTIKNILQTSDEKVGSKLEVIKENIESKHLEMTLSNREDSQMNNSDDEKSEQQCQEQINLIKKDSEKINQADINNLLLLAGSPSKIAQQIIKIEQNTSNVFKKRNYLYDQLKEIPVTVEQTSCLQILEDFLRNRIKNDDEIKQLKIDPSSFSHHAKSRGEIHKNADPFNFNHSNIFEQAINSSHYQSITQKMLRKNLQNGAKKILDTANIRLSKILNSDFLMKTLQKKEDRQRQKKKKKLRELEQAKEELILKSEENMDEIQKQKDKSLKDEESSEESNMFMEEEDCSVNSEDYQFEDEMMIDLEEKDEEDEEINRQAQISQFVIDTANEIINSNLPDDQQIMLAKVMTRQHAFMMNYLEMNIAERENKLSSQSYDQHEGAYDDEMQQLESKIDDFQHTMELVYDKFMNLKSQARKDNQNEKKANPDEKDQNSELKLKQNKLNKKFKNFIQKINNIVENDSSDDQEMKDEQDYKMILKKQNEIDMRMQFKLGQGENDNLEEILDNQSNDSYIQFQNKYLKDQLAEEKDQSLREEEFLIQQQKIDQTLELMTKNMLAKQEQIVSKQKEEELKKKKSIIEQEIKSQKKEQQDKIVDKQVDEIANKDLDELIKNENGNDVEFEFYFEGNNINQSQSIFEIIKDSQIKKINSQQHSYHSEQFRMLKEKEEQIRLKKLEYEQQWNSKTEMANKLNQLNKESEIIKEICSQLEREMNSKSIFSRGFPPPSSFLHSIQNAHKIYFRIKDKTDEVAKFQRNRFDSLIELTNKNQRLRTYSQAVQDLSDSSVDLFVQTILCNELKVFDSITNDAEVQDITKVKSQESEINQLEKSLKIQKVINFIYSNQSLFSEKGMRFMQQQIQQDEQNNDDIDFSDFQLQSSFIKLRASVFHHQKLDSYLQRSIKDPYNLVQGVSPILKQLLINCPFLFPFTTKQLYFKLVSFISSIDVSRSIYYLRQFMKQQNGINQIGGNNRHSLSDKDNLKKIQKQKVKIQRDKLIQSAFNVIQKIEKRAFLEFEFEGEEGTGLGPTLEFYDNIAEEFKKWNLDIKNGIKYQMWKTTNDNLFFPYPICVQTFGKEQIQQVYEIFRLCGIIVAKAIADDRQIDLPISSLFWKLCLGKKLSIFDIQQLDQTLFQILQDFQIVSNQVEFIKSDEHLSEEQKQNAISQIVTLTSKAKIEDYGLCFTYPGLDYIELIPNGSQKELTIDNVQEYIDLVLDYTFQQTINIQIEAFKKGFNQIFPINSLIPFIHSSSSEDDLETMICGIKCKDEEWHNQEELMKYIQPDHGYTRQSDQFLHFIRYITELKQQSRQQFLKFLTGSKRLPIGGFKSLQPNLTLVLKKENLGQTPDQILPSVMACQNYVKCPTYSSFEVFRQRFDLAVLEGQQNFTLS